LGLRVVILCGGNEDLVPFGYQTVNRHVMVDTEGACHSRIQGDFLVTEARVHSQGNLSRFIIFFFIIIIIIIIFFFLLQFTFLSFASDVNETGRCLQSVT
jgi:hypothetical protein